jgi:hypothetical protein
MNADARDLVASVRAELEPRDDENRLVRLISTGEAPRSVFRLIAAEEARIVRSDWRSFLHLAARADEGSARAFFAGLAQGEAAAMEKLAALYLAIGLDEQELPDYEPLPGCQAYPAYVAWLALNGEPAEVIVALTANFAAWGRYCAVIATAMREHYGFDDAACGFFDLFGTPDPGAAALPTAAVQAGLDTGRVSREARRYARLFQSYELMFWNTLAEA